MAKSINPAKEKKEFYYPAREVRRNAIMAHHPVAVEAVRVEKSKK